MAVNDYCTYQQVVDIMPDINFDNSGYQTIFSTLATRASRLIDSYHKRKAGAYYVTADETRYYDGSGEIEQSIDELAAAPTSVYVSEDGTTYTLWAATDYIMYPYNALLDGIPYTRMDADIINGSYDYWYEYPRAVKVTGKFGFSVLVPDEINQACIIQTVRWFKRGQQGFQDTGAVMELAQMKYVQKLDPDVQTLLDVAKFTRITI